MLRRNKKKHYKDKLKNYNTNRAIGPLPALPFKGVSPDLAQRWTANQAVGSKLLKKKASDLTSCLYLNIYAN